MTRVLLLILAVLEMATGVLGMIAVVGLFSLHNAGMLLVFWPLLAGVALMLVAGAAIFVRRPWSYYVHILIVLVNGAIYVVYLGPMLGPNAWPQLLLQAAVIVAPLTLLFLLPSVRRYFGVAAQPPKSGAPAM